MKKVILNNLSKDLKEMLCEVPDDFFDKVEEIKIRAFKPIIFYINKEEFFINEQKEIVNDIENAVNATQGDITKTLELMSDYSLYAHKEEFKSGFITLAGGHRVGLTGKTIVNGNTVCGLNNINGLNIRLSHEIKGCSYPIIHKIANPLCNTLIISPPSCGKTTILRDIILNISNGFDGVKGINVGLVDERSEIAGCYNGIPQNDVGMRTDVLDRCPKHEGMLMLLRSMSPKIIAVDEIGAKEDVIAIRYLYNAGVKLICTVHGDDVEDVCNRLYLKELIEAKIFERYVVLKSVGKIEGVYDSCKVIL